MPYLLDSDVFIQAKNLHYGFDFCPAFWDWIVQSHSDGVVFSIEKVFDEIDAGADELSHWVQGLPKSFFLEPTTSTLASLGAVSQWATSGEYTPAAISTFLQIGDYYLVSQALDLKYVVVTHEVPADSIKKIKIPNACVGVGVKYVTPYEMLRREKAKFVMRKV